MLEHSREPFPAIVPARSAGTSSKVDNRVRDPGLNGSLCLGVRSPADSTVVFAVGPNHLPGAGVDVRQRRELSVGEDVVCGVSGGVLFGIRCGKERRRRRF